jgi:hypothetical protein
MKLMTNNVMLSLSLTFSISSIMSSFWWNFFFVKFMKIWKKILSSLASKIDWRIEIKVKFILMITTSLSFKMVCYIMMDFCMYLMALLDSKYSKLFMMFQLQVTLDSTRSWNYSFNLIGGQNFGNMWRSSWGHVMSMHEQRIIVITHMDSSSYCQLQHCHAWFSISMNFITNLPHLKSYNSILVMVNRLTKMVHFIHCNKTLIVEKIAKLFFDHVFQYHSLLKNIIYDFGPHFTSKFWKRLFEILDVKVKLLLAFHP